MPHRGWDMVLSAFTLELYLAGELIRGTGAGKDYTG
jgi:hypothetical protein